MHFLEHPQKYGATISRYSVFFHIIIKSMWKKNPKPTIMLAFVLIALMTTAKA